MNRRPVARAVLMAGGLLTLGATGCVSAPEAANPEATLSPRVQALIDANRRYPRWEDFPRVSAPPPATEIAGRVSTVQNRGVVLASEAARIEWNLSDPEGFAREVSSRVDQSRVAPVTAQTQADIDAFAQSLRDRATAPPPVDRPLPAAQPR